MATFFEKNRKKSALAALLLFLKERRTVTALLLLVALASLLFVSQSRIILHFPGGARVAAGVAWMAGHIGVDTSRWGAGGKRDYGDLLRVFRAAKEGGGRVGWSAFVTGGEAERGLGSLGFVRGSAGDLGASGESLPKLDSIQGILNADDAKNRGEGKVVALTESDLSGERANAVKSVFASADFFGGKTGAVSGGLSDVVRGGLEGTKTQPVPGVEITGAAKGKITAAKVSAVKASSSKGMVGTRTISGQRAFVQLAVARGRATISVEPNCSADSGCPGEFGSVNTGAVYDGNTISGDRTDILTAPQIDGISSPNLPDSGLADGYIAEAEKMEEDAEKCREADDKYGPIELENDQKQEALSREFDEMGCGSGGCSKSKAKKCKKMADEMKALCKATMETRCKHIAACPLTAGNTCNANECDGEARTIEKVVSDDGTTQEGIITGTGKTIRTETVDQGEGGAGCQEAKKDVKSDRQDAQNALDSYRGAGCEALYASPLATDKLKYLTTCSGRESQVVSTCQTYAQSLCSKVNTCSGEACTADTSGCVITDLDGIQEFLNQEGL